MSQSLTDETPICPYPLCYVSCQLLYPQFWPFPLSPVNSKTCPCPCPKMCLSNMCDAQCLSCTVRSLSSVSCKNVSCMYKICPV